MPIRGNSRDETAEASPPLPEGDAGCGISLGRILLYAICVPIISLFISVPLVAYLDDRFRLSEAGSSDLAVFFVFMIGLFSTGCVVVLLERVIKGRVTRMTLGSYVRVFLLGNGVLAFGFFSVLALRHDYDIGVEAFLAAILTAYLLSVDTFMSLRSLYARATGWSGNLFSFESAVRASFDFLSMKHRYSGPEKEEFDGLLLAYSKSSDNLSVAIGWERGDLVPSIGIKVASDEGEVVVHLSGIFEELGVVVDSSMFPFCEKVTRLRAGMGSFIQALWIQLYRKREILLEYPRFLEVYGIALRDHHGAILEEVRKLPVGVRT